MPATDLYSNRDKPDPDVWVYTEPPQKLRVQISQIIDDALGPRYNPGREGSLAFFEAIEKVVAREHGLDVVGKGREADERVRDCLRNGTTELFIDVVEVSCRFLIRFIGTLTSGTLSNRKITVRPRDAVIEINERCKRAGFGYRFEDGNIIRIDNELLHQSITKPALRILSDVRFSGADAEFREAHEHYKVKEYRDCAVDALNALESTMKIICELKRWEHPKGARASDLLKVLRKHELFPEYADGSFDQLFATLKSGLPVLRNEVGGHGAGSDAAPTPEYVATYALHLSGAKIRFLYGAFEESGGALE